MRKPGAQNAGCRLLGQGCVAVDSVLCAEVDERGIEAFDHIGGAEADQKKSAVRDAFQELRALPFRTRQRRD